MELHEATLNSQLLLTTDFILSLFFFFFKKMEINTKESCCNKVYVVMDRENIFKKVPNVYLRVWE